MPCGQDSGANDAHRGDFARRGVARLATFRLHLLDPIENLDLVILVDSGLRHKLQATADSLRIEQRVPNAIRQRHVFGHVMIRN